MMEVAEPFSPREWRLSEASYGAYLDQLVLSTRVEVYRKTTHSSARTVASSPQTWRFTVFLPAGAARPEVFSTRVEVTLGLKVRPDLA
jgi:hypothetical protein